MVAFDSGSPVAKAEATDSPTKRDLYGRRGRQVVGVVANEKAEEAVGENLRRRLRRYDFLFPGIGEAAT